MTCGDHFAIILGSLGIILGPLATIVGLWDTWATSCCMGGPCIEFIEFPARFWTLRGSPFSPLGVTISFPGFGMVRIWYFVGNLIPG